MQEARLIVPPHKNDGTKHWQAVEDVRALLLAQFGGYTETRGTGGWVGKTCTVTEPIIIFDVAMAPSAENEDKMRTVAGFVRHRMNQDCVYLRQANGQVEFVSPGEGEG